MALLRGHQQATARAMLAMVLALAADPSEAAHKTSAVARLHQTVRVGSVHVTPLEVVEESRCPRLVTCVWRGRLRITALVAGARLTLDDGVPVAVRRGRLVLVEAKPLSERGERIPPAAYRFQFRFDR